LVELKSTECESRHRPRPRPRQDGAENVRDGDDNGSVSRKLRLASNERASGLSDDAAMATGMESGCESRQ